MTAEEVYSSYLFWLDGAEPCSQHKMFRFFVANIDVLEDQFQVVNRLIYGIPSVKEDRLRYFLFFEENLFHKDGQGDLYLVRSEYSLW